MLGLWYILRIIIYELVNGILLELQASESWTNSISSVIVNTDINQTSSSFEVSIY